MGEEAPGRAEVRRALAEDHATDDRTVHLLGAAASRPAAGQFLVEERCVVAGLDVAAMAFHELAREAVLTPRIEEGRWAEAGTVIADVQGPAGALLSAERTALNFLQHLSGIATRTRVAVEAVQGTGAAITHTRKTLPGLRALQVRAVVTGGGVPNRTSLAEAIYWKDNHWQVLGQGGVSLGELLQRAPAGLDVWVEVESDAQFDAALGAGVTRILADNQPPARVAEWVQRSGPDVIIQASGGITEATAAAYARAGARLISLGSLTHSVRGASITFALLTGS